MGGPVSTCQKRRRVIREVYSGLMIRGRVESVSRCFEMHAHEGQALSCETVTVGADPRQPWKKHAVAVLNRSHLKATTGENAVELGIDTLGPLMMFRYLHLEQFRIVLLETGRPTMVLSAL